MTPETGGWELQGIPGRQGRAGTMSRPQPGAVQTREGAPGTSPWGQGQPRLGQDIFLQVKLGIRPHEGNQGQAQPKMTEASMLSQGTEYGFIISSLLFSSFD